MSSIICFNFHLTSTTKMKQFCSQCLVIHYVDCNVYSVSLTTKISNLHNAFSMQTTFDNLHYCEILIIHQSSCCICQYYWLTATRCILPVVQGSVYCISSIHFFSVCCSMYGTVVTVNLIQLFQNFSALPAG